MSKEKITFTEEDLAIFPPGISLFITTIFLILVSHGLISILFLHFLLEVPPGPMILLLMGSAIFIVIPNIMVIRGHPVGAKILSGLAIFYFIIGVLGTTKLLGDIPGLGITLIPTFLSALAFLIILGKKYRYFVDFMAKRWSFYRSTGRTVLEEYLSQQHDLHNRHK